MIVMVEFFVDSGLGQFTGIPQTKEIRDQPPNHLNRTACLSMKMRVSEACLCELCVG